MEELKESLRRLVREDRRFFRDLIIEALGEDGEELVDVLLKSPGAKARLASELASVIAVPLNVATKEDVKRVADAVEEIRRTMAAKDDLKRFATKKDLQKFTTKEDLERIASKLDQFATKQDLEKFATKEDLKQFATKEDLKQFATKEDLEKFATKQDLKQLATKEDLKQFATKEDLEKFATKEDLQKFATKEDLKQFATKEDLKQFATKEDLEKFATKQDLMREIKRLENVITALGARWGVMSEEAFREGLREILREAGWTAEKEVLRDEEGLVHGEPGDVEYDVVVKDGAVILLELTSAVKRGDVAIVDKKRQLYERVKGVKVAAVYIVTPFIHDRQPEKVLEMAERRGIKIVYPTP
ncbi:MAG: DUF3782 domain-containing protein [Thermoproteus sp.]